MHHIALLTMFCGACCCTCLGPCHLHAGTDTVPTHGPCCLHAGLTLCPTSLCRSAGPPSQLQRGPQSRSRQAADPFADSGDLPAAPQHKQPGDPFAEAGSGMPARQVPAQEAGTDDFLDMFQGAAAPPSGVRAGAAAGTAGGDDDDLLGGFAGSLGESWVLWLESVFCQLLCGRRDGGPQDGVPAV